MKAIAVTTYVDDDTFRNIQSMDMQKPGPALGRDLLVKVHATSVNPIDMKVRQGVYDDYPDYFSRAPKLPQVLGFEGSGVVEGVGPECELGFRTGDKVFYLASPFRHASNAEYVMVSELATAHKPRSLDFAEAAGIPLTGLTAWESLVERLEIKRGENAGILIINGAGGVGSIASQIARRVLKLPVVITTASKPDTREFSLKTGQATHVVDHHGDIARQIRDLRLAVPIKYCFITHTPVDQYVKVAAEVLAPFGKVCSIVQGSFDMFGTAAMAKSLTFVWGLLGTKSYFNLGPEILKSHHEALTEIGKLIDDGQINHHITKKLPFTVKAVREGHKIIKDGSAIGKMVFSIDQHEEGYGHTFQ